MSTITALVITQDGKVDFETFTGVMTTCDFFPEPYLDYPGFLERIKCKYLESIPVSKYFQIICDEDGKKNQKLNTWCKNNLGLNLFGTVILVSMSPLDSQGRKPNHDEYTGPSYASIHYSLRDVDKLSKIIIDNLKKREKEQKVRLAEFVSNGGEVIILGKSSSSSYCSVQ